MLMKDKICLITGATDGIGKETARYLGKQNAQLILVGRNPEKGEKVRKKLRAKTGNNQIEILTADLSNMKAIRYLAERIYSRYDRLDVLINNAGALFAQREETDEGLEKTFALNHLNYFLLTKLLLDLIKKGKTPRIINVASGAHIGATLDFDNLQGKNDYSGWVAYKRSKLMNIMFTYKLAELLKDTPITVNTLHPGFVRTRFGDNNTGIVGIGLNLAKKIGAISIKKGAETSVFLATSPTVKGLSGKYFVKCKPEKSSPDSYNKTYIDRLWKTTDKCLSSFS